ncbi:galactose-specific lectin nattectin-like [Gadus chalcogrammus]|uniref:galactose-specific lectin nattectin-like n=1 Tax=Gadus chalcogrammus TaxID=1042646 RepID=UPI0024C491A4|nr:galactose-specific lectin nattectin-like [Gadus chalcogrammus]
MFLRSVLLCGLHALALAGLLTEPSADSKVKLERGSCPPYWYESGTDCYKYVSGQMTWADAELQCQSLGANLVSIHSASEMIFITALIENFDPTKGRHWIGFSDLQKEGSWMWSDGSPRDFATWFPNQPNNEAGGQHCGEITFWKLEADWNDAQCKMVASSVCKLRKTCP